MGARRRSERVVVARCAEVRARFVLSPNLLMPVDTCRDRSGNSHVDKIGGEGAGVPRLNLYFERLIRRLTYARIIRII